MLVEADAIYEMSGVVYSRAELAATIEAEAATLPPETWRGEWNLDDYMIEAMQVGIINQIHPEDDFDNAWWEHSDTEILVDGVEVRRHLDD